MKNAFKTALATATIEEKPKTKKSSMPEITNPPADVAEAVDEYERGKVQKKQGEAIMGLHGPTILDFYRNLQDVDGYAGNFHNSYKIHGNTETVTVVSANYYSMNIEDREEIAGILGDKFNELIKEKFEVKLKDEVLQNELLQNELMALIGDRFNQFFEVVTKLEVVDDFKKLVYRYMKPQQLEKLRVFVKQKKASIK